MKGLYTEPRPFKEAIDQVWARLVGKEVAQHSWPRSLSRGRLLVEVENSGYLFTLSLKKNELLQGLIELLGANRVRSLSFRMGEGQDA